MTYFSLPSRQVPWLVRGQVLFGGVFNQIGWLFLGFSLIFVWVFAIGAFSEMFFMVIRAQTAPGAITDIRSTNASENDTPIYANHYIFRVEAEEKEYRGISYTTGNLFTVGQAVTVEYMGYNPNRSRIQGARSSQFGAWVACLIGIFPLVGLGFVFFGLKQGIKANRLLAHGQVAAGKLVAKERTNAKVNRKRVYKLTFEFTADDGQRYQTVAHSHRSEYLEDEATEQILYHPPNPRDAVLVDNLPGSPRVDELGQIQIAASGWSWLVLILPALVIMACLAVVPLMLWRS
jgi:hypothetical protein